MIIRITLESHKFTQIIEKYFDDGEPGGTAGAPIMEVLLKNDLVNVLAVVIRYFGGIKLGTGLLTRSYLNAAKEVIYKQ